jgi:hypothetical protein
MRRLKFIVLPKNICSAKRRRRRKGRKGCAGGRAGGGGGPGPVLYAEEAVFVDVAARGIAGGRRNIGARYFCALASGQPRLADIWGPRSVV